LRPLIGKRADELDFAWKTAKADERHELEVVAELLRLQIGSKASHLLQPPRGDEADGPIRLGQIKHGKHQLGWLGVQPREIGQHMLITGRSGSGKSVLGLHILRQLSEQDIPFALIDFKRSARDLKTVPGCEQVEVVAVGRNIGATLHFNPLVPPPGVDLDSHIRFIGELIAREWFAGDGVVSLLERSIRACFENPETTPTLADIYTHAQSRSLKGRELQWSQSLNRILGQLTTGQLGRVLNTRSDSAALDILLNHCTIIELDGLASNDAQFVAQYLVYYINNMLLAGETREQTRFVVLVEEAHRLLGASDGHRDSPLGLALKMARESGLGIICATQSPATIDTAVTSNVFTSVSFSCRQRGDIQAASGSLLLTESQKSLLSVLPTGQAVARISERWPYPIHLQVPPLAIKKGTYTDKMIASAYLQGPYCHLALDQHSHRSLKAPSPSSYSTDPTTSRSVAPDIAPRAGVPPGDINQSPNPSTIDTTKLPQPPPLPEETINPIDADEQLQLMLKSIADRPLIGIAERADRLHLSRRKVMAIKSALTDLGYIAPLDVPIPEGRTVLLKLLPPALRWLKRHHITPDPINGSLQHAYWQQRLGRDLTALGWSTELEAAVSGGRIDVRAIRGDESLLIEVETGASAWKDNFDRLAQTDARHKAVLWLSPSLMLKAQTHRPRGVELLTPKTLRAWLKRFCPSN
jgi:hypothetical protein